MRREAPRSAGGGHRPLPSRRTFAVILLLTSLLAGAGEAGAAREMVGAEGGAFDQRLVVQAVVMDPVGGREAVAAAMAAVSEIEMLLDPVAGVVQRLNDRAGKGPQVVDPQLFRFLQRSLEFCHWSENRHGPLGGWLYTLWGLRQPVSALPGAEAMERGRQLAACDNVRLDARARTVELAPQTRVEPWGFAAGFAVDRAVEVLAAAGVDNATVLVGGVQRGVGGGPDGRGWALLLPPMPERLAEMLDGLRLSGRSIAVAAATIDGELRLGGERYPPYVDQRQGRPAVGELALSVAAASELALDAQGVAVTCFVAGSRHGMLLVGQLRPAPAVVWAYGGGGRGLVTDYRWSTAEGTLP